MNFMEIAYKEAEKAFKRKEIPVGAVIVKNNKVISKSRNNRQFKHTVLGHAEINAILKAEKKLKDWRLDDCTMYVTLEPCEMCSMLIKESRIKEVYYLISKKDNKESNFTQTNDCDKIIENYKKLLNIFFENLRS